MLRFFCALLLSLCAANAWSNENLLGLPTPHDPAKPGAVLLHGGGPISSDAFDRFCELAGGKQARIVFVPSAGYRPSDYESEQEFLVTLSQRYSKWVGLQESGQIKTFQFLYTDDPDHADDAKFVESLALATGVWFSGGDQSRLNYRFVGAFPRQTLFQKALRGVLERGGVVGGTSAGMAALPEVITLRQEREPNTSLATAIGAHGLGVFNRAIVEQHFDGRSGRFERFSNLLRDNTKLDKLAGRSGAGEQMTGIAVEERTALVAQGNRLEVLGASKVHIFLKASTGRSITWHELAAGETAQLKREVPNFVMLAREESTLGQ